MTGTFGLAAEKYKIVRIVYRARRMVNKPSRTAVTGNWLRETVMINPVNGVIEVDNPAEVLRNQDGVFEVTSPYGHVFQVVCRRGIRMSVREISEPQRVQPAETSIWRIRRIARAVA